MKAQAEMVGLVFIVLILVFGLVLYMKFSTGGDERAEPQTSTAFLTAMLETDIPGCGLSFQQIAAACVEGRALCASGDPCREAGRAMQEIASHTLSWQGLRYNLSVQGTGLEVVDGCNSSDPEVLLSSAFEAPIILSSGSQGPEMVLSVCRP